MSDDTLACTTSLFEQPWWLDAVAPGKWRAVTVEEDDEVVARMTFVLDRRFGMTFLRKAPLTPTYGPYLKITAEKEAKILSQEIDLLERLISRLPAFDALHLKMSPRLQNWLPFYWSGFDSTTSYTYRFKDLSDLDAIWHGMRDNIRRYVRKAQKVVEVQSDLGIEAFMDVNEKTYERQGQPVPYSRAFVRRLDHAATQHDARRMFFAVDDEQNVHAAVYVVYDDRACYNIMLGGDPEYRNSGATSLVLWEAIQYAATVSQAFDFEGSMLRPVEQFFRAFGADQTPYHSVSKSSRRFRALNAVKQLATPWR